MAKYPQYVEYKESCVERLGQIPIDWTIFRLKNVLKIRNGRDYKEVEVESGGYPVYGSGGIFKRSSSYLYDGKSILFGRKGTIDKPLLVSGRFWTVDTMFYSEIYNNATPKYIYYQSLSFPFNFLTTNTALPSMTQEDLLELIFVLPSLSEQLKIANFLDHETAQIDTLIDKQQTLIQLLKEKRQAVISHAVTKGLNPDAPMKDSGVEWLGEVPKHWIIMQFRRITSLSQGLQIPQSERIHEPSRNNVEYITIKSIHAGDTLEHREYINKPSLRVQCDYDDVLLARTGATGEVVTGVKGAFHNNFFKIDYSEKITKNFLVNMLKVQELKSHLLMLAGTTTIPDLNHGAFLSTVIALPSLDEQEEICAEIFRLSEKYSLLLEVAIKQVKLLQERRTALISAAVTGKVDVRGWRAPD